METFLQAFIISLIVWKRFKYEAFLQEWCHNYKKQKNRILDHLSVFKSVSQYQLLLS